MSETPKTPDKGRMLPGVAGIAMFLLVLTLLNVFAALKNTFGVSYGKYGVLALCTILVAGLFGLLRMRRCTVRNGVAVTGCMRQKVSPRRCRSGRCARTRCGCASVEGGMDGSAT